MKRIIKMMSLVSILSFFSCSAWNSGWKNAHITEFSYSYDGTIGRNSYHHTVKVTEQGPILEIQDMHHWGKDKLVLSISPEFVQALEELCRKHNVMRYDGFKKTNRHVCDGSGFSLYIRYDNGQKVDAYGMNRSPKGYHDFESDLRELFQPYLEEE